MTTVLALKQTLAQRGIGNALAVATGVVALGLLAGATDDQIPLAVAVAGVGTFFALLFIKVRSDEQDASFLCTILILGVVLRCVIALVNHYLLPAGAFALDDGRYNEVGRQLVAYWNQEGSYPGYIAQTNQVAWFYVNGAIYWLWGFVPLVPAFLNCVIGPVTAIYVFYITREAFDRESAIRAAMFAMFFPSIMLWSSINLKDALTSFAIIMVLWNAIKLHKSFDIQRFTLLILFMILLGSLRSYLFVLTGLSIIASLMISRIGVSMRGVIVAMLLISAFMGVYQRFGFGSEVIEGEGLATVNEMRGELAEGDSAYAVDVEIETPLKAIAYLPKGLGYFLLAPTPWQISNLRQALTFPEMILWYALIPSIWRGVRYALKFHFRPAVILLFLGTTITVAYAMVESNLGTAYRHRAQVLVIYLIFAAIGLVHRKAHQGRSGERSNEPLAGSEASVPVRIDSAASRGEMT